MSKQVEPNTDGDSIADAIAIVVVMSIVLLAIVYWLSTF